MISQYPPWPVVYEHFWGETRVFSCFQSIIEKMDTLSKRDIQGDAFIFTILSHGDEHEIQTVDKWLLDVEKDLFAKISKCESLTGKPKVVFIQACRGGELNIKEMKTQVINLLSWTCPGRINSQSGSVYNWTHHDINGSNRTKANM